MANNRENPFGLYGRLLRRYRKNYWTGRKLLVHQRRGIASSDHLPLVGCDLRAVNNCRDITTYTGDNSGDTSFRFVNKFLHAVNLRGKSWVIRSSIGELSVYHAGPPFRQSVRVAKVSSAPLLVLRKLQVPQDAGLTHPLSQRVRNILSF